MVHCLPVPWRAVPEQAVKSGAGEGCLAPLPSY